MIYPIIVAIILALVDAYRIDQNIGVVNISKVWTVFYAGLGYCGCLMLVLPYDATDTFFKALIYLGYYIGVRGVIYGSFLSLFRGLNLDYFSTHTNSKVDRFFANLGGFWALWGISVIVAIYFGWLWLKAH